MNFKRRGVFLVEMLTVVLMVGVGGTLMAVALASMLKSQERVARLGDRFATTNDFIHCIRDDVRSGAAVQLQTFSHADSDQPRQLLTITRSSGPLSYRFFAKHVEREGGPGGESAKSWTPLAAEASVANDANGTEGHGVKVIVRWQRDGHDDPDPSRRFDLFVRCAGELHHAED